ncbi:MAG: ATP-dependent DNA helicase RecG [Bacilli bacterium]|nr:ATP-dependent DNA helicase RecG [Bacilli bacterium]
MAKSEKLSSSPRINSLLYKMGIFSYYDVVNHLPRRYDDYSLTRERDLLDKERVTIYAKVVSQVLLSNSFRRVSVATFDVLTNQGTYFKVVAYNRPYLPKIVNINEFCTIIGTYDKKRNSINLINIVNGKIEKNKTLRPVYTLPKDFANKDYIRLVNKALSALKGKIVSSVPLSYRKKYRLINKETALEYAHNPKNNEELRQSLRYLKYEEALLFSLKNQLIKEENKSLQKIKKEPIDLSSCESFLNTLPYKLTDDQEVAAKEIIEDMNQPSLMYRLLQGDVGTGKTLVSFVALYANYVRGNQGALMAPTEVLARQHYENAMKLFKNTKLRIALLVGSLSPSEKKDIYRDIEDGSYDIIIGTHALFTKSVVYSSLGLVIIDEQHRFGVNQRKALMNKGDHADLLMMSATPIPRSLALSIYGDLEISTLYKFPNIKRDVTTKIVNSESEEIMEVIGQTLEDKRKVYVVAPLIEFSEDGKYSVEKLFARFVLKFGAKVGLLHGKMKQEEKEEVLDKFVNGDVDILVSTQVIEVGIDVKKASAMVIYDANSFGLASLHQLRGRIGRDGHPSICLLAITDMDEEDKLEILVKSNDGFEIAEKDLSIRGPGELVGIRQSGIPDFRFLNMIDDIKIFIVARDDARYILANKNNTEFTSLINYCKNSIEESDIVKA